MLLMFCAAETQAQNAREIALSKELKGKVAASKNANDSIKALFDLYDVSPRHERIGIGRQIYDLAGRIGNHDVQVDILRLLSTNFEEAQPLELIEEKLEILPKSDARDEAMLFVRMRKLMHNARRLSEDDRQKEIVKILNSHKDGATEDKLAQIYDLYNVVLYMRNDATGDMLKEYVDKLIKLVNSPDIRLNAIKNLVYSEASNIYSDAEDYDKAIESSRILLKVLDNLEADYRKKGRMYKKYDVTRYLVYRRMLRNAKALRPGEAKQFYDLALKLAETNSDIQKEIETNPRIHAYYYMAVGDYNAAVPVLKDVVNHTNTLPTQKRFLEMLIEASEKTGDNDTKLEALSSYVSILKELDNLKASQKSRELQISYDVRDLRARNEKLETENRMQEISTERSIMIFVTVAFVIIFIVLLSLLFNWTRYRRNVSRMGQVVDNMHRERHRLRDTIYSDNYDIDPLAEEERFDKLIWEKRMKERHLKMGDATIFMTESIVNDLLYIAWVGHKNLHKFIVKSGVDSILRKAESRISDQPELIGRLNIEFPESDIEMETDADCLSTLMGHIFFVVTRYKPADSVDLMCRLNGERYLDFIVTLNGAAPASAEGVQIFRDMPISDILLNYENSGLYVCRMIALLLQCEIIPDKTYDAGARYILRVPRRVDI